MSFLEISYRFDKFSERYTLTRSWSKNGALIAPVQHELYC